MHLIWVGRRWCDRTRRDCSGCAACQQWQKDGDDERLQQGARREVHGRAPASQDGREHEGHGEDAQQVGAHRQQQRQCRITTCSLSGTPHTSPRCARAGTGLKGQSHHHIAICSLSGTLHTLPRCARAWTRLSGQAHHHMQPVWHATCITTLGQGRNQGMRSHHHMAICSLSGTPHSSACFGVQG